MSKFPDDEKTPISTFNLPEETDIKTPELTCAETIAMFFNNIDTNRTANQRTIDTANFVLGCNDLCELNLEEKTSPWFSGSVMQRGNVRFNGNQWGYFIPTGSLEKNEVTRQIVRLKSAGFSAEMNENLLTVKNPHRINIYETGPQMLRGWPHSENSGLEFIFKAIDECRRLGIKKINIDGLDGDDSKKVCNRLTSIGYTVITSKKGSKLPRIIATNSCGDHRLTLTVNL